MTKILKIQPGDTVARFYLGLMKQRIENGSDEKIVYAYKVPKEEADKRIAFINENLDVPQTEAVEKWQKDNLLSDNSICFNY